MLPAEDHKRLLDGDRGANTGGMGAYAPSVLLSKEELQVIEQTIIKKTISSLQKENIKYVGKSFVSTILLLHS
jgi:phosphoribosylamine-glycine ligase